MPLKACGFLFPNIRQYFIRVIIISNEAKLNDWNNFISLIVVEKFASPWNRDFMGGNIHKRSPTVGIDCSADWLQVL